MKKLIVSVVSVLLAEAAFCAATTHLSLDCRERVKVADNTQTLVYDATWYEGGVTAKITANGSEIVSGTVGAYAWTPSTDGVNLLTLNVYNDSDEVVGMEQVFYLSREDLAELVIPEGTTEIGEYAFVGGQFTSVTIPNSVTNVAATAFAGCASVESLTFCPTALSQGAECESVSAAGRLGTSATLIWPTLNLDDIEKFRAYFTGPSASYPCFEEGIHVKRTSSGVSVQFHHFEDPYVKCVSVLFSQGDDGVYGCVQYRRYATGANRIGMDFDTEPYTSSESGYAVEQLTAMCFPCSVKNLLPDSYSTIKQVTILDETRGLERDLLEGCEALELVAIPAGVTNVGANAFAGCESLSRVNVPSMADWLTLRFANAEANPLHTGAALYVDGKEVTELVIPEGTTEIGEYAFAGGRFTSVTIPNSVTNVAPMAFAGCSNILEATVGGVEWMEEIKPGLLQRKFNTYFDRNSPIDGECDIVSGVLPAYVKIASDSAAATTPVVDPVFGRKYYFNSQNTTFAYSGYMWMRRGRTYVFGASYDDGAYVKVDGIEVLNADYNADGRASLKTASYVCEMDGWHQVEFRVGDKSGGKGPWGDQGWSAAFGLGFRDDGLTTAKESEWRKLMDPGDGSLFRVEISSGGRICNLFPDSCAKMKSVTFLGGIENFDGTLLAGCESLETLVLPESVRRIEAGALCDFPSLRSVAIPSQLESFGLDVIQESQLSTLGLDYDADGFLIWNGWLLDCENREAIALTVPEGVVGIGRGAFENMAYLEEVALPNTLKSIAEDAFRGCTSIESVELPEGLVCVGDGAFRDCTWMQEVVFPSSLANIGKMAFANCTMLAGVECFDGLQTVDEGAFSNCWRMLSVALPVTVDEIGPRAFYNCKNVLGVSLPTHVDTIANLFPDVYQTLQSAAVAEGETEIVAGFFGGCKMLQEIALSNMIREIPDSTFEGCTELLRVQLPSALERICNRAFYGCVKLSEMVFPSGLVSVGNSAFYGCDTLSTLEFPDELVSIGNSAFQNCGHVNEIKFGEKLREIGDDAFNGLPNVLGIVCPASVRKIGTRAFKGTWNDLEIRMPEGLESLGADAFANCAAIRRVVLPVLATPIKSAFPAAYTQIESVKILGAPEVIQKDFCRDVAQLTAVQIPGSVTNIESYAFSGLPNLAAVALPPSLRKIGEYAFSGDSRLSAVALPQTVEAVGYRAFCGCGNVRSVSCSGELDTLSALFPSACSQITSVSINEGTTQLMADLFSGCTKLSEIDLPFGITAIGARAFQNCTSLAAFGVPNGVVTLGDGVFGGCSGLTSLSLPEGLENVPARAFQNCRAISSIVIPASVNYIGANAFDGCTALKSVSYLGSCPQFDSACYSGTPSDLSSYVVFGSRGWDGIPTSKALPECWPTANARAITYWEPNTFEATFDGNGGTPSSSTVVQTTGMTYVLPEDDPQMLGARFDGWWTQPVNGGRIKTTTKVEVTRAQTFYAHWKYNGYSVRFDANGGIGEMEDQVMTVNAPTELAPNRYLRKGCRFEGWALSPDGEVAFADGEEVENLSLEHHAVVPLYAVWAEQPWDAADYLNAPGRAFAYDGDAEWVADDEVSHDGIGSMRSGAIAAADEGEKTTSVLQTTVVGTGSGSFWWKVDCEPADGGDYYDYCAFFVDDAEIAKIAGTVDWEKVDYQVAGAGEHVLKWVFTRDDWDEDESLYENAAWVDEFAWAPTPVTLSFDAGGADGEVPASVTKYAGYTMALPLPSLLTKAGMVFVGWSDGERVLLPGDTYTFGVSDAMLRAVWEEKVWTLEEAANLTGVAITTGGDANWTVDLATNYDGEASIRSGQIGDSQQTWVSVAVQGAGTISFRTLVSGEFSRGKVCDYLKFEVDGTEEFSSYDASWSNVVLKVSGRGTHTLKWTYLKNASKSAGDDCAWLDEIVWEPDAETEVVSTVAELADVFGAESEVVKEIKDEAQLAAFNQFLKDCAIASASDMSAGQKTWAYQSFKMAGITTAPQLFEEEPVLKFDDVELNGGNLVLTVSLHAGEEAIALAKDKLAEKIRVGTSLDAIVGTPQIVASPSADGTSLTFTVAPPQGDKGFVRILIE